MEKRGSKDCGCSHLTLWELINIVYARRSFDGPLYVGFFGLSWHTVSNKVLSFLVRET